MKIDKSTYSPYRFGYKLALMGKYAGKHLAQFSTREDRINFCRGYSAGIDAIKRIKQEDENNEI